MSSPFNDKTRSCSVGETDRVESPDNKRRKIGKDFLSTFNPATMSTIQKGFDQAAEDDPLLVLNYNREWLDHPGNLIGKFLSLKVTLAHFLIQNLFILAQYPPHQSLSDSLTADLLTILLETKRYHSLSQSFSVTLSHYHSL
jgi:hypothetical protein